MKTQGSHMERCITRFLLLFSFFAVSDPSFAQVNSDSWMNRSKGQAGLILGPEVSFYSTSTNLDSNADRAPISGGSSLSQMNFSVDGSYGFTSSFFLFGRISYLNESIQSAALNNPSHSGFSNQVAGIQYQLNDSKIDPSLGIQLDVSIPAYSNASAKQSRSPYLGEGSTDFTLSSFVTIPNLSTEFGLGYRYRSNGFSADIPFQATLKKEAENKGFLGSLGVRGQFSLKTDSANSDATLQAQVNQDRQVGAGGSNLIGGINPSFLSGLGSVGYRTSPGEKYSVTLSAPLIGTNVSSGLLIAIGAEFSFPSGSVDTENNRQSAESSNELQTSYDLSATVESVNDQLYLIKIGKGSNDHTESGQIFDIFTGGERIARARVTHVKADEAALIVLEYFQDHWIEKGFTAKRLAK